jgi:FeS assembly SUF system protein
MNDLHSPFGGLETPTPEEYSAQAGSPRAADAGAKASDSDVTQALRTVFDPEIPVNIYDLGLIYETEIADNGDVAITMSLTAPNCPVAGEMPQMVADAVAAIESAGEVSVRLVWDPPWTPERMSDDARLALGMD